MAKEVDELALKCKGKESLAVESFAKALREIPAIIADNAGLDSAEVISSLKSEIYDGSLVAGIDIIKGSTGSMQDLGVYECYKVKEQALTSACEAAELILRVDQVITCAPRKRERE